MSHKPSRPSAKSKLTDYCSTPGEDDGVDPRFAKRASRPRSQTDRKTLQLCAQVAQVVESLLSGEIHDDDLSGLQVASVVPTSQRGKLLITVTPGVTPPQLPAEAILDRLRRQAARIRAEVSESITRRKTPDLSFAYVPNFREDNHE